MNFPSPGAAHATSDRIALLVSLVASRNRITSSRLLAFDRGRPIARLRAVTIFAARAVTSASYPELGSVFSGRDHATILHAIKTVCENPDELAAAAVVAFEMECAP